MTDYIVFREEFQHDTWEPIGRVMAESTEAAVKTVNPGEVVEWGTFAAIPSDEFNAFVNGRTLHRIVPRIESVEPVTA